MNSQTLGKFFLDHHKTFCAYWVHLLPEVSAGKEHPEALASLKMVISLLHRAQNDADLVRERFVSGKDRSNPLKEKFSKPVY